MSIYFYDDALEIGVNNPGYGEIQLSADPVADNAQRPWERLLVSEEIGRFLTQLTTLALTGQAPARGASLLPRDLTQAEAAGVLPEAQRAVVYAVAGTELAEQVYRDLTGEPPPRPVCVNCSQGHSYAEDQAISLWCAEHGHTPFGWPAGTTWQDALDLREARAARWHRARELEARP